MTDPNDPPADGPPADGLPAGDRLGAPIDRFRPPLVRALLELVAGVMMVPVGLVRTYEGVCGIVLLQGVPWWRDGGDSAVFTTVTGLALVGVGPWLARRHFRLLAHEVELCERGFRYADGREEVAVRWHAVAGVREVLSSENLPFTGLAGEVLPKGVVCSYEVVTRRGEAYSFDEDSVRRIDRFGRLLRESALRNGIPWDTVRGPNPFYEG
jgi:hypothetical protein